MDNIGTKNEKKIKNPKCPNLSNGISVTDWRQGCCLPVITAPTLVGSSGGICSSPLVTQRKEKIGERREEGRGGGGGDI